MKEQLDGGRLKGGLFAAHLDWIRERRGESAFEALLERVSPETAQDLTRPVSLTAWYPFRTLIELDRAIAAGIGGDPRSVVAELGRESARRNIARNYRATQRPNPQDFFAQVVRLHPRFQDFGSLRHEATGRTSCRMESLDLTSHSQVFCWSTEGFYEEAIRLQGGLHPRVRELRCLCRGAESCLFEIRWEAGR